MSSHTYSDSGSYDTPVDAWFVRCGGVVKMVALDFRRALGLIEQPATAATIERRLGEINRGGSLQLETHREGTGLIFVLDRDAHADDLIDKLACAGDEVGFTPQWNQAIDEMPDVTQEGLLVTARSLFTPPVSQHE